MTEPVIAPAESIQPDRTLTIGIALVLIGLSAVFSVIGAGLALSVGYAVQEHSRAPAARRWGRAAAIGGGTGAGLAIASGPTGASDLLIVLGMVTAVVAVCIALLRRDRPARP